MSEFQLGEFARSIQHTVLAKEKYFQQYLVALTCAQLLAFNY